MQEPAPDEAASQNPRHMVLAAVVTPETEATAAAEPRDKKAEATAWVQRCFAKLGYYKGPIDGKANDATWTAHWYFKNEHGMKAYGDFLAEPVQKKLKALCKDVPVARARARPRRRPEAVKAEAAGSDAAAEAAADRKMRTRPARPV